MDKCGIWRIAWQTKYLLRKAIQNIFENRGTAEKYEA